MVAPPYYIQHRTVIYSLTTLRWNGTLSCVDFMDTTMGDAPSGSYGADRKLRRANMYAHLSSVRFQKWRHGSHIVFLTPMITLFWPIS